MTCSGRCPLKDQFDGECHLGAMLARQDEIKSGLSELRAELAKIQSEVEERLQFLEEAVGELDTNYLFG